MIAQAKQNAKTLHGNSKVGNHMQYWNFGSSKPQFLIYAFWTKKKVQETPEEVIMCKKWKELNDANMSIPSMLQQDLQK